jgi:hypothetical protein
MTRTLFPTVLSFIAFLIAQVVFFKNAVFMHTAFCFFYIGFLLRLPVQVTPIPTMLSAFAMGLLVDMFYDSMGLHAMAGVMVAFVRPYWLSVLTPQGGYDSSVRPAAGLYGYTWFLVYIIPLLLIHHGLIFFTEAGGFAYFWTTLGKVAASVAYTTLTLVLLEQLSPYRRP